MQNYEDKIYSLGETVTGQTQAMSQAVQKTLENNGGVGIMTGSYDQNLSILSVDNLLLHSTGYTFDTFMEQTKGSLKNFFYDEEDILERDRFLQLHGTGEAQILTADGTVNNVRLCKEDATDEAGRQIWVMSVQVNWDHVNLALLNEAIYSGFWYFDCDENSEIVNANWSHEFRKMLGYHDTLDFPNKLESWSDLLHPQDKERVMVQLQAAIKDKTNQIKYQVEYRMRMKDNQYQWFRASAEVIRRLDGSASRIAGIFINIDAEKKEIMQAQKSAAFHRAFTKADLCEYYVNLEANTFDTFKVEPSLLTFQFLDVRLNNTELIDTSADNVERVVDSILYRSADSLLYVSATGTSIGTSQWRELKLDIINEVNLLQCVAQRQADSCTGRRNVFETSGSRHSCSSLEFLDQLPGIEGIQEVDVARTAVDHFDRKLPSVIHIDARRFLIWITSVLKC
jgi:PAS domain-containing protein